MQNWYAVPVEAHQLVPVEMVGKTDKLVPVKMVSKTDKLVPLKMKSII